MSTSKIVIKVGTNVLTQTNGRLDLTAISRLVDQIAQVHQQGHRVILISSGAVGAGKALFQLNDQLNRVTRRQVYAATGQVRLMNIYADFFANYDLFCAQVLATKEDFRDRIHYLNMQNCFRALLQDHIIPVVNENDVISVSELMFTDNDELAGLIAAMVGANTLLLLSNVEGIYNGRPEDPGVEVIPRIEGADKKWLQVIAPTRSSMGRGGMLTKYRIAQQAAKVGISTYIANGKRENVIPDIIAGKQLGTCFPAVRQVSTIKRWIAYNNWEKKAQVIINAGAEQALCSSEKITSLLPIGITNINGAFEKGDVVQIENEKGSPIGLGIAQYNAKTARSYLGKKGKKALIHYDYLYISKQP